MPTYLDEATSLQLINALTAKASTDTLTESDCSESLALLNKLEMLLTEPGDNDEPRPNELRDRLVLAAKSLVEPPVDPFTSEYVHGLLDLIAVVTFDAEVDGDYDGAREDILDKINEDAIAAHEAAQALLEP